MRFLRKVGAEGVFEFGKVWGWFGRGCVWGFRGFEDGGDGSRHFVMVDFVKK